VEASYATDFAGSTHNYNKMAGAPNKPIKSKIFPKKVCIVPIVRKGQNFVGGYDGIWRFDPKA
jgi:hypothetical protein